MKQLKSIITSPTKASLKITSFKGLKHISILDSLIDIIFISFVIFVSAKILKIIWNRVKSFYRRKQIEQLQNIYNPNDINIQSSTPDDVSRNDVDRSETITNENESQNQQSQFLNNARVVSSNINNYKQREIISDYKDYEDYLKKQKLAQEQPNNENLKLEYKPLDLHEKLEIKDVKKFFNANLPEIERRIPWTQDKIDIAQIPNNELCRKSITGMMFDCGVPAANNYLYEGTN